MGTSSGPRFEAVVGSAQVRFGCVSQCGVDTDDPSSFRPSTAFWFGTEEVSMLERTVWLQLSDISNRARPIPPPNRTASEGGGV